MNTTKQTSQKSTLTHSSGYNPMFFNGKEINHLVFFDSETGKTILEPENENIRWFGSNNNYHLIELSFEIKGKREVNLNNKFAFFVTYKSKWSFDKGKIVIYIPIQLLSNFKSLGRKLDFETETEKKFLNCYSFTCNAVKHEYKLNKLKQIEYFDGELKEHTFEFNGYYSTELKELGKKIKAIEDAIKPVCKEIGKYEIEKMLQVLDITIK